MEYEARVELFETGKNGNHVAILRNTTTGTSSLEVSNNDQSQALPVDLSPLVVRALRAWLSKEGGMVA